MSAAVHLEAPDFAALDTIVRRADPFVLWPVGPRPLVAEWMDHVVAAGAKRVRILAVDRPHLLRDYFAAGDYWSCPVDVLSARPADWPADAPLMDRLPQAPAGAPPADAAALVARWLEVSLDWVRARGEGGVSIDRRHPSGGWVGPHVRIHPSAVLTAPFWIGAGAEVGERAHIGPDALVGDSSVIDADAEVADGVVLAGTYVGQHVAVRGKLADGGVVLDARRGCRVDISETFILSPLADERSRPGLGERALALVLALLGGLAAAVRGRALQREEFLMPRAGTVAVGTGVRGPLLVRRRRWLWRVVAGHWRLVGVLPRTEAAVAGLAPDVREALVRGPVGVFSLADVHGCHRAGEGDEWIHALYQVSPAGAGAAGIVGRQLGRLAWKQP